MESNCETTFRMEFIKETGKELERNGQVYGMDGIKISIYSDPNN